MPIPSPEDLPDPEIEPGSPALQADSLPAEPQGKPKNTGVPIPSPEDLTDPGIKLGSPALQVDCLLTELSGKLIKMMGEEKKNDGRERQNCVMVNFMYQLP